MPSAFYQNGLTFHNRYQSHKSVGTDMCERLNEVLSGIWYKSFLILVFIFKSFNTDPFPLYSMFFVNYFKFIFVVVFALPITDKWNEIKNGRK